MSKIIFSNEEISNLRALHKSLKDKRLADRVKVIIALSTEYTYETIEELLLIDERTIRRYQESFLEKGIDGLLENKYKDKNTSDKN